MDINEDIQIRVNSQSVWNSTNVMLQKGYAYSMVIDPDNQEWTDGKLFKHTCKTDGYSHPILNIFSFLKRYRHAKWFCLMGSINQDEKIASK